MTVLRFEISERDRVGRSGLPPLDLDDSEPIVIGSGAAARVRLPASAAREQHVRIASRRWRALADAVVDGEPRTADAEGTLDRAIVIAIGSYDVRVSVAPTGATPSPPQRTESLARELVRDLLGGDAAPALWLGDRKRGLAPPESRLVIGRGDEADWRILDEDLSREHVEIVRKWDGVTLRDLESKNGTRIDGVVVAGSVALRDGARIALGSSELVFRDPAEQHLMGTVGQQPSRRSAIKPPINSPAGWSRERVILRLVLLVIAMAAAAIALWLAVGG